MTPWLLLVPALAAIVQGADEKASFPCRFVDYRIASA